MTAMLTIAGSALVSALVSSAVGYWSMPPRSRRELRAWISRKAAT